MVDGRRRSRWRRAVLRALRATTSHQRTSTRYNYKKSCMSAREKLRDEAHDPMCERRDACALKRIFVARGVAFTCTVESRRRRHRRRRTSHAYAPCTSAADLTHADRPHSLTLLVPAREQVVPSAPLSVSLYRLSSRSIHRERERQTGSLTSPHIVSVLRAHA